MKSKLKSLRDVKTDMSELYEEVKSGACQLRTANELANIAGKYLKAESLEFAREVFLSNQAKGRQASDAVADVVVQVGAADPSAIARKPRPNSTKHSLKDDED